MGFCYRYVNIERNGVGVSHYALIDSGSELSTVSEEIASKLNLQMMESINIRGTRGSARGWRSKEVQVSLSGGVVKLNTSLIVASKMVTGEEVIIGRDILESIEQDAVIALRLTCDSCKKSITQCRCTKRQVRKIG